MKSIKNTQFKHLLKTKTQGKKFSAGRNCKGRITVRHRGGRHPRLYRDIDTKRQSTQGIVTTIEYDPNRAALLARVYNPDTKKQNYILAPTKLAVGDIIRSDSGQNKTIYGDNGHSQRLRYINTGRLVYNLSLKVNKKSQLLRAPGAHGQLLKKTRDFAQIKLRSGERRWFHVDTLATLGIVSNPDARFAKKKKAGQSRWRGYRPKVRGVAMNPVDHPHGGGEGKTSGGRPSVTPWGKPTKGPFTGRIRPRLNYYATI